MAVDASTRPKVATAGSARSVRPRKATPRTKVARDDSAPHGPDSSADRGSEADQTDVATPLDSLLVEAAFSPFRRFNPGLPGLRMGAQLASRPLLLGRAATSAAAELARVVLGSSTAVSAPKDRRFADQAWSDNPALHRLLQAYLVTGRAATELVANADLDGEDRERLAFVVQNIVEALSPSNSPVLNPTALKAAVDSGGVSYLRGVRNFARDMAVKPRVPTMVDTTAFAVGDNIAVTPGSVVMRTEVFELIQYTPATTRVRTAPLLMVPPTINKYYVADLAEGRSMVEHFVASGQQVFMVSWRNPGREQSDWGLDEYVGAVIEALGAVEQICRTTKTVLFSLCAGGIISSLALAHLVATGQEHRLAGFALGVTLLDQSRAGLMSSLTSPQVAAAAAAKSRLDGFLDGRSLAEIFAWLRPGDLVWNYWVNNYLLGRQPPAFDVLYWNADTTRMAAQLHADFLDLAVTNALTRPGEASVLGTPVDLSAVTVDSYVVAGISDHICPWTSCYRSVQMLGGHSRFVLSTSGHVAALVNPPGNPKASFRASDETPVDPQEFLGSVEPVPGSWWTDFVTWLTAHSGREKVAPKTMGSSQHPILAPAPGTYVHAT